jgi:hypothetical protein
MQEQNIMSHTKGHHQRLVPRRRGWSRQEEEALST